MDNYSEEQNILYSRYNTDDIFNRSVIGGLLYLMNNKITYQQVFQDNVVETVHVPCAFNFAYSLNERFMQDNYTFFGQSCFGGTMIDGKFDMLPRCAVSYTGSQIEAGSITNRFIKGKYLKNENGRLTTYESYLYALPVTFSFDCEMWADNMITAFKLEEAVRQTFYKNKTYNVLYRGMKIGCCVGFPETNTVSNKTTQYQFSDTDRQIKLNFSLAVETYQPVFDDNLAIEAANRIEFIGWDVRMPANSSKKSLKFKNLNPGDTLLSNTYHLIEWDSPSDDSDMCTVLLSYITEDGTEHKVTEMDFNQRQWAWYVPQTVSSFKQPVVTLIGTEDIKVVRQPEIRIAPNMQGTVDASSFIIIDPGKFTGQSGMVSATIEYIDECGDTIISMSYSFNVRNGEIDMDDPVVITGDMLVFTNIEFYNRVSMKIRYLNQPDIYDQVDNILIL